MLTQEYHKRIVQYYQESENAYKDAWDLENSLAIHYGYHDQKVKNFAQSLQRMNEVMMDAVQVSASDHVLDAGCGVGGSAVFLARQTGCRVTGISLSERQVALASANAEKNGVKDHTRFHVMNYSETSFPDASFDVVWGCESICYAEDKNRFIREAFRLLKPGGRLVVADGFVTAFSHNDHPVIRRWLDGWQVNFLETAERFTGFMRDTGLVEITHRDISREVKASSRRLRRFYWLASLYLGWKKINFSAPATDMQKKNIAACKYQYLGLKKGLWQYGLVSGKKP